MGLRGTTSRDLETEFHALSGWGESRHGWARVHRPRDAADAARVLAHLAGEGRRVTLRGAGRSYGDAALQQAGDVLDLTALTRIRSFDPVTGRVDAEAGVTVEALWRTGIATGWWPAVVPGTMRPTLGGCLAMNIHGKNHYRAGGFADHVEEVDVALPDGSTRTLGREADRDMFNAVAGGFGLLGLITGMRISMHRVHSGLLDVEALPTSSIAEMAQVLDEHAGGDGAADYLVGWVDAFHGKGRGVVHVARYLAEGADPDPAATLREEAQDLPPTILGVLPRAKVPALMRPFARPIGVRGINLAKQCSARLRGHHHFRQSHVAFAFLLDYVPDWKSVYRPGGLLQYQRFLPAACAAEVFQELVTLCRQRGTVSWLGVFKKHRPDPTLMSHALEGFSLALDFPVTSGRGEDLLRLCEEMDRVVLPAGGRFYFAKDQTATPEALVQAYPDLPRFRELRRELDPEGVLTSDLAVRLGV